MTMQRVTATMKIEVEIPAGDYYTSASFETTEKLAAETGKNKLTAMLKEKGGRIIGTPEVLFMMTSRQARKAIDQAKPETSEWDYKGAKRELNANYDRDHMPVPLHVVRKLLIEAYTEAYPLTDPATALPPGYWSVGEVAEAVINDYVSDMERASARHEGKTP